jgi:hypothetical protein
MSMVRRQVCALLAAVVLASCAPMSRWPAESGAASQVVLPLNWLHGAGLGQTCRATADGRPLEVAERGVGGTGPLQPPAPKPLPGTSDPTGVAAIITGFGSVCLAGLEVGLAPDLAVSVDGAPAAEDSLRAGQRAALTARWEDGRPVTGAIAVRHEVVGPIDALGADGRLTVAGQPVRVVAGDWRAAKLIPGAWVAVSGLRAPDGVILASRIDPAAVGDVLLRGRLAGGPDGWRMGLLAIDPPAGPVAAAGAVVVQGRLQDGRLQVAFWQPDTLETNPAGYFGPAVHRYAIQALVAADGHALASYDFKVSLPRNMPLPNAVVPAVIGFERMGMAGMAATSVSPEGETENAPDSHAEPGIGMPARGADGSEHGPGGMGSGPAGGVGHGPP